MFSVIVDALRPRKAQASTMAGARTYSVGQCLKTAGILIFLAPLIVILGTLDILTGGRSRNWP